MIERIRKVTISGPGIDRVMELPEGPTTIGRQPGVDLLLPDDLVSRRHAVIECEGEQYRITDLKSSNGTRINGKNIQPNDPTVLQNGALIEIGPYRLVFEVMEMDLPDLAEEAHVEGPSEEGAREEGQPDFESILKMEGVSKIGGESTGEGQPKAEPEPAESFVHLVPAMPILSNGRKPSPNNGSQAGLVLSGSLEPPPGLDIYSRRLISYLPGIYHSDFMQRFMGIFESIQTPIEWTIDNFDLFLDPGTAPSDFMPWLASWFVLTFDSTWNETQRRQLLAEAHQIFARRGTPWALRRVLEIYTGESPQIDDQSQDLEPHTFRVTLPVSSEGVNVELVKALINANKPAHTSYSLNFADGG
jgi:phage tail-like protein